MAQPVVQKAAQAALDAAKEHMPEDFNNLQKDASKRKELEELARATAQEQLDHSKALKFVQASQSDEDLAKGVSQKLGELLPSDRVKLVQTGLQIPSYRLNFRFEKGNYYVDITKSGEKYLDSVKLDTAENFASISGLQIASIVVEAIGLALSLVGVVIPEEVMAQVATKVATEIAESPAIQKAVEVLKSVFSSGGSGSSKAKAIWELLKAVWEYRTHGNIFVHIVKLLVANMSWWERIKAVAMVVAMIVAAVATDGVALIAKIILALNSAYEFTKKILNLNELDEIRAQVKV